jgi:hypothetical protein
LLQGENPHLPKTKTWSRRDFSKIARHFNACCPNPELRRRRGDESQIFSVEEYRSAVCVDCRSEPPRFSPLKLIWATRPHVCGHTIFENALILVSPEQITRERPETRKPVARIHILLYHIKREIIKPAEAPDRNRQQHTRFQSRLIENQQRRRERADNQKQNSFQLNPASVG